MAFVVILVFTASTLFLAAKRAPHLPLPFTLHLVMVAVMLGGHQFVAMLAQPMRLDGLTLLWQVMLLGLYVAVITMVGRRARRRSVTTECDAIHTSWLIGGMLAGLAFKGYLLTRYGLAGLSVLRDRDMAGISITETVIDTLLLYVALGAFWLATIRLGKRRASVPLLLVWGGFWVWPFIAFEALGGGRRFVIATVVLLGLAAWQRADFRFAPRVAVLAVALVWGIFAMTTYFQAIRMNLYNPEIQELIRSDVGVGLSRYLTPAQDLGEDLRANLADRPTAFGLLSELTALQLERPRVAGGRLLAAVAMNAVPRDLFPAKEFVDADGILWALFGFAPMDLSTSLLAVLQAEMLWGAYLVTPLLIGGLVVAYSVLLRWAGRHGMAILQLAAWAALLRATVMIEEGPELLLVDARHVAVIAGLLLPLLVARHVRRRAGGGYPTLRRVPVDRRSLEFR